MIIPRRSVLYVPGTNPRAHDKARALPCDCVLLDLEDSVAPDEKERAREQALASVRQGGFGPREVILRTNTLSSPWGRDDLIAAACSGVHAILLPKVEGPDGLAEVRDLLSEQGRRPISRCGR